MKGIARTVRAFASRWVLGIYTKYPIMRSEIRRRLTRLLPQLEEGLAALPLRAIRLQELRRVFLGLAPSAYQSEIVEFAESAGLVERIELVSTLYPGFTRYLRKGATPFEVALSLRSGSYLSHGSAVFLHGLNDQIPRQIYVNREQSPKPEGTGPLAEAAVEKAFAQPQRRTNYILRGPDYEVVLLSGKSTGRLEVGEVSIDLGKPLSVTKVERTLIDIVVRPLYAGGVFQVLEAFRNAKGRISVGVLLATLKKLKYRYPYHQAMGFYMEKAGFEEGLLQRVEALGVKLDFYLNHGLTERGFSERWRLFHPKGF